MKRDESNRVYWFQTRFLSLVYFVGCFYHKGPALSFVGVHGPYELHRKKSKLNAPRYIYIFLQQSCRGIAYFNTKMSYLSDFKRTKSHLEQPAPDGLRTAELKKAAT